jgi:hypothetical protein
MSYATEWPSTPRINRPAFCPFMSPAQGHPASRSKSTKFPGSSWAPGGFLHGCFRLTSFACVAATRLTCTG